MYGFFHAGDIYDLSIQIPGFKAAKMGAWTWLCPTLHLTHPLSVGAERRTRVS